MLRNLTFEVTPYDPSLIAGAVVAVLLIATIAVWLPVRRAARINPVEALSAD